MEIARARRLLVPYFSAPNVDELFGSWLARLTALNAKATFSALGPMLGLPGSVSFNNANPVAGGESVRRLALALGYGYEEFTRRLTTRAYWDCFRAANPLSHQARRFVHYRRSITLLHVCPACVSTDWRTAGNSYFHRSHQLRAKACPKHGLILQDSCGKCGQTLCLARDKALLLENCRSCGADIRETLRSERASRQWRSLAIFSAAALAGGTSELDSDLLFPLAASAAIAKAGLSIADSISSVLSDSFGDDGHAWLRSANGIYHTSSMPTRRPLAPQQLTPLTASAVLVACGITYDSAREAVAVQKSLPTEERLRPIGSRGKRVTYYPASISAAKSIAQDFVSRTPLRRCEFRRRRPFAYWLLFFKARMWLRSWLDGGHTPHRKDGWGRIPSLRIDRQVVAGKGTAKRHERQMARARASVRDKQWLERRDRSRRTARREGDLAPSLKSLREEFLALPGRPRKFTIKAASRRLKMSDLAILSAAKRNPQIRRLIPETPFEYRRRMISWAIDVLVAKNLDPLPWQVARLSQVRGEPEEMKVIRRALAARNGAALKR